MSFITDQTNTLTVYLSEGFEEAKNTLEASIFSSEVWIEDEEKPERNTLRQDGQGIINLDIHMIAYLRYFVPFRTYDPAILGFDLPS